MGCKINWTEEASGWMEKVFSYIVQDSPHAAQRLIDDIYRKAEILKRFPEMGYRLTSYTKKNARVLLYGHYRIAYLLKKNNTIDILGVFHGALDLKKHLKLK